MANDLVFGIRPVAEAIQTGKQIEKLYIRKGAEGQLMTELRDLAFRHRIRIQEVPVEKLNRLTRLNHQGVVAYENKEIIIKWGGGIENDTIVFSGGFKEYTGPCITRISINGKELERDESLGRDTYFIYIKDMSPKK